MYPLPRNRLSNTSRHEKLSCNEKKSIGKTNWTGTSWVSTLTTSQKCQSGWSKIEMSQTETLLTTGCWKETKFQWDLGGQRGGEGSGYRHKIESLRGISLLYEKSKKLVDTKLLSVAAVVSKHTAVRLKVSSMADSNSGGSSNNYNHLVSSIFWQWYFNGIDWLTM